MKKKYASNINVDYIDMCKTFPKLKILVDKIEAIYDEEDPRKSKKSVLKIIPNSATQPYRENWDCFRIVNLWNIDAGVIDIFYKISPELTNNIHRSEIELFSILAHEFGHFLLWEKSGKNRITYNKCVKLHNKIKNSMKLNKNNFNKMDMLLLFINEYSAWKYGFLFIKNNLDEIFEWNDLVEICIKYLMTYWHINIFKNIVEIYVRNFII
jgi:hypothetical protein